MGRIVASPAVPVIARRPKADEAISALGIGFVFADAKSALLLITISFDGT